MAARIIRIVLDPSGARQGAQEVRGQLDSIDRSSRGTRQSLRALAQAAGVVIGALSIRELGQAADAYTNLQNRIRLVTDSQEELLAVQDGLIGVAQRTRTDLSTLGELYGRVARSTEQLGATQAEVLQFTESVSQAIQISGATAAEASAGVIQFAQGLASGALRGDELRSVLEQTPRLALAIADSLGVTIGELRELGAEGALTADQVFQAVLEAGPELQREFALVTPTIGQVFTTIRNFGTVAVGSINEALGVTEGLNQIFTLTDETTQNLARTFRNLGLAVREAVEVATVAFAIFAEGVTPFISRLRADIAGTIGVILGNDEVVQAAIEQRNVDTAAIDELIARFEEETRVIRLNNEARQEALENRSADLDEAPEGGGTIGGPDQETIDRQREFLEGLQRQAAELAIQVALGDDAGATIRLYNTALDAAALGNAEFQERAREAAEAVNEQERALEAAQARLDDADLISGLEEEIELIMLGNRERAQEIAVRQLSAEATQEQIDAVRELAGELFDEQERLRGQTDFLQSIADQAARNIQDTFADFLFDPFDEGLEGLVRGFADALRRMAADALAAQLFESLFGGAGGGGGFGAFLGGIFGGARQMGGGVRTDQAFLVGESGPELFRPPTAGAIVPAGQAAMAMAAPEINNSTTIINTIDESEITGAFNSGAGDQVLLNRITTKRNAFRRALGVQ